jgi:hypothetical protein
MFRHRRSRHRKPATEIARSLGAAADVVEEPAARGIGERAQGSVERRRLDRTHSHARYVTVRLPNASPPPRDFAEPYRRRLAPPSSRPLPCTGARDAVLRARRSRSPSLLAVRRRPIVERRRRDEPWDGHFSAAPQCSASRSSRRRHTLRAPAVHSATRRAARSSTRPSRRASAASRSDPGSTATARCAAPASTSRRSRRLRGPCPSSSTFTRPSSPPTRSRSRPTGSSCATRPT